MNLFTIDFTRSGRTPLYEQLYDYIVTEIASGRLMRGERLPSKKSLAAHLGISTNTVETGYNLLIQEGYIYSKPKSGYYVSAIEGLISPGGREKELFSHPAYPEYKYDFRTNAVDEASFPYKIWAKLSRETLVSGSNLLTAGETRGDLELRNTLAKYLHEFRGVSCDAGQVVIGAGVEYLLTLLCGLLTPASGFAIENPGYIKAASVLKNSGGVISYIPMDGEGMIPGALRESGAAYCYLTPSHQFPTGVVMPVGRRYQLLGWGAESDGRYIIEDDYNSEFTFSEKPIPAMQGLDSSGKVIYISTFSRTLAPSIRIAYMVLPTELSESFDRKFGGYSSTVSRFEQQTLMKFISDGYLGRHLNRVKNIYRKRRDFLIGKLDSLSVPGGMKIRGGHAGLHLLVTLSESTAERVMERAHSANVRIYRLCDYYFDTEKGSTGSDTLILGFAGLDEEALAGALDILFAGL